MTAPPRLTSHYRSGDLLRSRSVSGVVAHTVLDLPALPPHLLADCEREAVGQGLVAGDVEPLSLARARRRWPACREAAQAMAGWTGTLGLGDLLAGSDIALMACRGARYHHDGALYGSAAFCNLFVSEDKGLDVHFPHSGQRLPLQRGTALLFDTGQPHAVVRRGSSRFDPADFADGTDCLQFFLTWELPIEDPRVARALGITFDTDSDAAARDDEQVHVDGLPAVVCPTTGVWLPAAGG